MANATVYVDNINGNNANTGLSEAQAVADIPTAIGLITGGGNIIYVQAGSNYTLTTTIAITASLKGDTTNGRNKLIGYTTTPGADDGRPIITSSTNSVNLITLNDNDYWEFRHLKFTHTAATRGGAFQSSTSVSTPVWVRDCIIDGCSTLFTAASNLSALQIEGCEITNTTSSSQAILAPSSIFIYGCDIHDNAGDGLRTIGGTTINISIQDSIFDTNAIGINEISTNANVVLTVHRCTFVDNTSDAIKIAAKAANSITLEIENNIFWNNGTGGTGYGIEQLDTQSEADANIRINRNNSYGSNATSALTGLSAGQGDITITVDPFTNKTGRDFSLNNTAGGGADIKAKAYPITYTSGLANYRDIGAIQGAAPTTKPFTPFRFGAGFNHV